MSSTFLLTRSRKVLLFLAGRFGGQTCGGPQIRTLMQNSTFASRLRALRIRADQSQEQVAAAIGAGQRTVSSWEKGDAEPGIGSIAALARHFSVSADYLCGLTERATPLVPNFWLVDLDCVDRMRKSEPSRSEYWACPIPERHAILPPAEFDALRRELESLPRRRRR